MGAIQWLRLLSGSGVDAWFWRNESLIAFQVVLGLPRWH